MAEFIDPSSRLDALIVKMQPKFRARFLQTVLQIRNQTTLATVIRLLETGNVEEALVTAEVAVLKLTNTWGEVFVTAGSDAAKQLEETLQIIVNFDTVNQSALDSMTRNQLRLVREFTEEQRAATRQAILDGIEDGLNPLDQARSFRRSIGLTRNQQQYVTNYRRELENLDSRALQRKLRDGRFDRTIRRAIEDGKQLTNAQINKMVDRYSQRWVTYRSQVIARTEALRSVHEGTTEMYNQAINAGTLDADEIRRTWDTSKRDNRRDHHITMEGQVRRIGQPFISGLGNELMQPGDANAPPEDTVQCVCALTTRYTDSAVQRLQAAQTAIVPA